MNELHYSGSFHTSSLGWDYHHNLGVLNEDTMSLTMDENARSFNSSPHEEHYDDFSSGYLEDAFIEFTSKRRRLLQPCSDDDEQRKNNNSIIDDFQKSLWKFNFNPTWDHEPVENLFCMNHTERISGLSGSGYEKRKKERSSRRRIVYPFAMVKPGGIEGDVTLNEINERIQMPPTRPVKHPVGDFASSPHGSALSGKPVLALTTIHTFGRRGTITIIRTKG